MSNFITNITADAVEEMRENNQNQGFTPKKKFDVRNYLNTSLAEGETSREIRIRILPISLENSFPFLELKTHSLKVDKNISKSGFKTYVCLNSPNLNLKHKERCPICSKATEYYQLSQATADQGEKKAYLDKAKSMFNKTTYIARVIERGKEDEGVKFWRFNARNDGKDPFNLINNLYKRRRDEATEAGEEEPYNIYDLNNGKDLYVTITRASSGRGVTFSVTDAGPRTPLSKDFDLANSWLSDEKVWSDMYGIKDANYLSIISEDLIPVWDNESMSYVGKTPEEVNNKGANEQAENEQIKREILNNPGYNAQSNNDDEYDDTDDLDDGLPF